MARCTLCDVLSGETWPDLVTIAALVEMIEAELWPRWEVGHTQG